MSKRLHAKLVSGFAVSLIALAALAPATAPAKPHHAVAAGPQASLDAFARDAGFHFTILSNADGMSGRLDLTTPKSVPQGKWAIYMSWVAVVKGIDSDAFDIKHINGDLYVLTPKATIRPGTTYPITFHVDGHFFSQYYVIPNAYVAADGLKPRIIDAARATVDKASGLEVLPFVADMTDPTLQTTWAGDATKWLTPERAYDLNASHLVATNAPDIVILPTPAQARHLDGASLDLTHGISLASTPDIAAAIADLAAAGFPVKPGGVPVSVTIDGKGAPESYHLVAQGGKITITAADSSGAYYALQSLLQQARFEKGSLKPIDVSDTPRFPFRGMHLDLARNFESKAHIEAIIEQMGQYKLNKLHLHLGDDEGWRVQIDGLPELTDIGSKRCHDLAENTCLLPELGAGPDNADGGARNGFLTRADYIEVLKYAKARHIEVIPSFDMPGHSRAAVRSMEARARRLIAQGKPDEAAQYRLEDAADTTVYDSIQHYDDNTLNICLPSTYAFIGKVIDSIKAMHDEAGLPLKVYHIGTDETSGAWTGSPACQKLMADEHLTVAQLPPRFIENVSKMLGDRGIEPAGWSDGMGSADPAKMPAKVQSDSWGSFFGGGIQDAYRQANSGWDIVMGTPDVLYFDMPYAPDPKERGYDWASRDTPVFKVFAFMPENLGANISVMTDTQGHGGKFADTTPMTGAGHITGMQGQLWSETVRSSEIADYMIFPRLQALAERAWHKASWEPAYKAGQAYAYGDGSVDTAALNADWTAFNVRLAANLAGLDQSGLAWRLPPPGAKIDGGKLEANVAYGNLDIDYQTGDKTWHRYSAPVAVTGPVSLRSVSPDGKRFSRIVTVGQ